MFSSRSVDEAKVHLVCGYGWRIQLQTSWKLCWIWEYAL